MSSGPTTTLPPGPLLSGRSEATDETQPSSDEKASARGDKPASGDPKLIPVPRSQDSQSPRERAERDLHDGGVESGAQDHDEPAISGHHHHGSPYFTANITILWYPSAGHRLARPGHFLVTLINNKHTH